MMVLLARLPVGWGYLDRFAPYVAAAAFVLGKEIAAIAG
jgi:hypothetical protein